MKKQLTLIAVISIALIITGCSKKMETQEKVTPSATENQAVVTPSATAPTTEPSVSTPPATTAPEKSSDVAAKVSTKAVVKTDIKAPVAPLPAVKKFSVTAKKWEFSPSTITVNKGDTVELSIKSTDVTHGFFLSEFNISKNLTPGETVTASFVADKAGSFSFICSVFCGAGHATMTGTLIVK